MVGALSVDDANWILTSGLCRKFVSKYSLEVFDSVPRVSQKLCTF